MKRAMIMGGLALALVGHLGALGHVAVAYGPERELERAYAAAPSCGCKRKGSTWCPRASLGSADCRWFFAPGKVWNLFKPSANKKSTGTYWVLLEVHRGVGGARARAEVSRFKFQVSEDLDHAVRRRRSPLHAELWRDRITRLRIGGAVHETLAVPAAGPYLGLGVYALAVVLVTGGLLIVLALCWRRRGSRTGS